MRRGAARHGNRRLRAQRRPWLDRAGAQCGHDRGTFARSRSQGPSELSALKRAFREVPMLSFVRAGLAAALVLLAALVSGPAAAAEKAFQRDDLADAAIKLEARIKS